MEEEFCFFVNSSNEPKKYFRQIRKRMGLKVSEVIIKCNINKYVYDRLVIENKISKANVYKICIGLNLSIPLANKFFEITGNRLNFYDENDYIFLKNYKNVNKNF